MQKKIIHIDFNTPVSQDRLNSFQESLFDFDLEFFGKISPVDITGEVKSTGMFHLIKAPLLKALDRSGLTGMIKSFVISNA